MKILKSLRVLALTILLAVSIYFLSSMLVEREGVIVKSLKPNSKCNNLVEGAVITSINNIKIKNLKDYEEVIKKVKTGEYASMIANNVPAGCFAIEDNNLGIEVEELPKSGLKFSDEIVDSKLEVFKVKNASTSEIRKVYELLENRLKKLKFPQTKIILSDDLIKISYPQRLENLLAKCELEIKISYQFNIQNGSTSISIGDNTYQIKFLNGSYEINNKTYFFNESFYIDGIKFEIFNLTNSSGIIDATVASNEDITQILTKLSFIRYDETSKNFMLYLPLNISIEAEENIRNIITNVGSYFIGQQIFLSANLLYLLDGEVISQMPIPRELRVKASPLPLIIFRKTFEEINTIKKHLDACLSYGKLEYKIEKVGTESKKAEFNTLAKVLFITAIFITFIPTLRFYKNSRNLLTSILLISEILTIFGIAGLTQIIFSPGWIIDLATIVGVLALTSFNLSQILFEIKGIKEYLFLAFGLVTLFTPLHGLGLSILFGRIVHIALIVPILKYFS